MQGSKLNPVYRSVSNHVVARLCDEMAAEETLSFCLVDLRVNKRTFECIEGNPRINVFKSCSKDHALNCGRCLDGFVLVKRPGLPKIQ